MEYYKMKHLIIAVFAVILLGCSSNDDDSNNKLLEITISNFETSYSQVKINWEITRPDGIIIQDLLVYRQSKNNDTDFSQEVLIANLPSNETKFIDNEVPYYKEVFYKIKINYTDERTQPIQHLSLASEQKKFAREIVTFDNVPFQVQKDPVQSDVFHILERSSTGTLNRYNSAQNKITDTKNFDERWTLNNRFQIINNTDIYVATYYGKIHKINTTNYREVTTFSTAIVDKLNAFAIDGDLIYYQDDEILKYHRMTTNISKSMNSAMNFQYLENLSLGVFLILGNDSAHYSGANVAQITGSCPDGENCYFQNIATTALLPASAIDPNIFTWNAQKTKFISSINGCIFNLNTLQQEKKLYDITGKRYIQYAYDNQNNIYAAVQGEKLIHKFNTNYELIEKILTKLYPIFPILTSNGLQVIGAYQPVSYWNYEYGSGFNFNIKCAIETF
jgi:hypothetical protein